MCSRVCTLALPFTIPNVPASSGVPYKLTEPHGWCRTGAMSVSHRAGGSGPGERSVVAPGGPTGSCGGACVGSAGRSVCVGGGDDEGGRDGGGDMDGGGGGGGWIRPCETPLDAVSAAALAPATGGVCATVGLWLAIVAAADADLPDATPSPSRWMAVAPPRGLAALAAASLVSRRLGAVATSSSTTAESASTRAASSVAVATTGARTASSAAACAASALRRSLCGYHPAEATTQT